MSEAFVVSEAGIAAPAYETILASLQAKVRAIYGQDIYLGNDSQDGQLLAIFARAIHDGNAAAIAVYNAFSPATAQGNGLSSVVRINGLQRLTPTNSTVDVTIVGVAGTEINDGIVSDGVNEWALPTLVTIPLSGEITVTATAAEKGAIAAVAGSLTIIRTPQLGWQSVTNALPATPGAPVESDAALRRRQTVSTMLPSRTALDGLIGGVAGVTGVTEVKGYENDTNATDANGMPPHSLCLVIDGGDVTTLVQRIANKKTPGVLTYGDVSQTYFNESGMPMVISFFRPTIVDIEVEVEIRAMPGYSASVGNRLRQALVDYVSGLKIGEDVLLSKLYSPANLSGTDFNTFEILVIRIARKPAAPTAANATISFKERAELALADVTLTVS